MRAAGVQPIVAVIPPGVSVAELSCAAPGAWAVPNPDPDRGMASSVRLGLAARPLADVDGLLLWPVDCPGVPVATVRRLLAAWRETRAPIVVPSHDHRRGHPALFDASLLPTLRAIADDQRDGVRGVVRAHAARIRYVEAGPEVLRDIDTPSDLAALSGASRSESPVGADSRPLGGTP